jgi:hypothetical protein
MRILRITWYLSQGRIAVSRLLSPLIRVPRLNLANHLRNIPHSDFVVLLQSIYNNFLNGVVGLQMQGSIIVDVLESIQ